MSTQITPGYQVRTQLAFSLLNGSPRAWLLAADQSGRARLVPVPFEAAKSYVEKDQADQVCGLIGPADVQTYGRQVPLHSIESAGNLEQAFPDGKKPCGCQGGAAVAVDVDVAGVQVQKTDTAIAFKGRGRLVAAGEASVEESLFAVAEPSGENRVARCGVGGACEEDIAGTPNMLVFDKYTVVEEGAGAGGYQVKESTEYALPKELSSAYADRRSHTCMPWVKISRDPERFRGCLAAARALGPIKDSKAIAKLVGDYLMKQDSEVFLVALLDVQLQLRGISEIARGARDKVDVPVPDCLRVALVDGATAVVCIHNHPSGTVKPSKSDIELTKTLKKAFKTVHLELLDHVIVAGDRHYSFAKDKKL
jgi:hypothetical protein